MNKTSKKKPARGKRASHFFDSDYVLRLELFRIFAPLIILGFMSSRLMHVHEWLTEVGYQVPDLGGTWNQPFYMAPISTTAATMLAIAMVVSGLSLSVGFLHRFSASIFALCLMYVALADRLSAFTVSKLAPMIAILLLVAPCAARYSVDAFLRRKRTGEAPGGPTVRHGSLMFLKVFPIVMYTASGICKARAEWLERSDLVFSHLYSSYQTGFSYHFSNIIPHGVFPTIQWSVLLFEGFAFVWLANRYTRNAAVVFAVGMHLMIGVLFGPVIWFSLLMIAIVVCGHAPASLFERWEQRAKKIWES